MSRNVLRFLTALTAFLALLGAARTALASGYEEQVASRRVSYTDLDLEDPADAAKLYVRLEHAARRVCEADLGPYAYTASAVRTCAKHAVADAVARIDQPNVLAVHEAHTGARRHVTAAR